MAGVLNKTARQFNVRSLCSKTKSRICVRIAPGFNVVPDDLWAIAKVDPYVLGLKKQGHLLFGKEQDDLELEKDPDTKAKTKVTPTSGGEDKTDK